MCASRGIAATAFAGRGGRVLGKIEEGFVETLAAGDTFLFAGLILRFEGIHENEAIATRTADATPKIPVYAGGKFPLTTYPRRAASARCSPTSAKSGSACRRRCRTGCACRSAARCCRSATSSWSRPFRAATASYMVAYPFEGRLAHQTLGMLLTRRLERARLRPTGFVASDYALAVWGLARSRRRLRARQAQRSPPSSTRTCSATISRPGWRRAISSSACSGTPPSSRA